MTFDRMTAPEWTAKHGYFLQIGGFKMVCTEEEREEMERKLMSEWFMNPAYSYHPGVDDGTREAEFYNFRVFGGYSKTT